MKRKICILTLIILCINSFSPVFAEEKVDEKKVPANLSLKEAVKIMQTTGNRAETAKYNKFSDEAIANGYSETVKTIRDTLNDLALLDMFAPALSVQKSSEAQAAGATETNKKVSQLRRDFAKKQIEKNYKAEMNQIEAETAKVYYSVLLAKDNLTTEQDNLKAQEDILKNTKLQYKVGMLAKKDVLSAESSYNAAKSSLRSAETKLEYAKMSFNYLLGYPLDREINFTDKLEPLNWSESNIDEAIKSALLNRNEIQGANFAVGIHKILLEDLNAYPHSSAKYRKQEIAVMNAEKTAKDAPVQIEIDLRNKKSELEDKKAAIEAAKAVQQYAKEGYRLINISYQAGMTTLAELQQAQVNVYKSGLAVSAATSDYNLAVYAYTYARDVGTQRLPL